MLEVEDGEHRPIPEGDGDYRAGVVPARTDLRPIAIAQPNGVSFSVEGSVVRWHRWSMVLGIDPQEGLVLHDVRYDERPLLHRASCAEMIVPYGEPDPMHNWRTFFDAGEYGLGACLNSLELGFDCLGEIAYLDAHLADDAGGVRTIANAICVHEEDAGLQWKHTDRTGAVAPRRGRRLDLDVDGTANRLREVESEPVPAGPDNPVGNAFRPRVTELRSELAARRDADDGRSRSWMVQSAETQRPWLADRLPAGARPRHGDAAGPARLQRRPPRRLRPARCG